MITVTHANIGRGMIGDPTLCGKSIFHLDNNSYHMRHFINGTYKIEDLVTCKICLGKATLILLAESI